MYSSAKNLRFQTKELLESVSRGEEIIITFRGKPCAKLVPLKTSKHEKGYSPQKNHTLFGIWKNRSDIKNIHSYIRTLRKRRFM